MNKLGWICIVCIIILISMSGFTISYLFAQNHKLKTEIKIVKDNYKNYHQRLNRQTEMIEICQQMLATQQEQIEFYKKLLIKGSLETNKLLEDQYNFFKEELSNSALAD